MESVKAFKGGNGERGTGNHALPAASVSVCDGALVRFPVPCSLFPLFPLFPVLLP